MLDSPIEFYNLVLQQGLFQKGTLSLNVVHICEQVDIIES